MTDQANAPSPAQGEPRIDADVAASRSLGDRPTPGIPSSLPTSRAMPPLPAARRTQGVPRGRPSDVVNVDERAREAEAILASADSLGGNPFDVVSAGQRGGIPTSGLDVVNLDEASSVALVPLEGMPVATPLSEAGLHDEVAPTDFPGIRHQVQQRLKDLHAKTSPQKIQKPGAKMTDATENQYKSRASALRRRYYLTTGIDPDQASPTEFAHWFLAMRSNYAPNSWRFMRQVANYVIASFGEGPGSDKAYELLAADSPQDAHMSNERRIDTKKKLVTSALKMKFVDHDDLARLDAYFRTRSKSRNPMVAINLLRASIATGLRPAEWATCTVVDVPDEDHKRKHRTYLFVLNAKATNGRGNGAMRTIDISRFNDSGIREIRTMAEMGTLWTTEGLFQDGMDQASNALYRACRKLWPKRAKCYGLYSGRHQFKLNMASLDLAPEEIAALMGHNVTETHTRHYGVRSKAWSIDKILNRPAPVIDEVATVRKTFDYFHNQQVLQRLAAGRKAPAPEAEEYEERRFVPEVTEREERRFELDGM